MGKVWVRSGDTLIVEDFVETAALAAFDLSDDDLVYESNVRVSVSARVSGQSDAHVYPDRVVLRDLALNGDGDDYTQNQDYVFGGTNAATFYFPALDGGRHHVWLVYELEASARQVKAINATAGLKLGDHVVTTTTLPDPGDACRPLELGCEVCADDATWTDPAGNETCADWAGYDCANANHIWPKTGYSPAVVAALLAACPVACGVCANPCAGDVASGRRALLAAQTDASQTALCYSDGATLSLLSRVGAPNDDANDDTFLFADGAVDATLHFGAVEVRGHQLVIVEAVVESTALAGFWHQSNEYSRQWYDGRATLDLAAVVKPRGANARVYGVPRSATLQSLEVDGFTDDYYTQNEDLGLHQSTAARFVFAGLDAGDYDVELVFSLSTHASGRAFAQGKLTLGQIVATVTALDAPFADCGLHASEGWTTEPSAAPDAPAPTATVTADGAASPVTAAVCHGDAGRAFESATAASADDQIRDEWADVDEERDVVLVGRPLALTAGDAVVVEVAVESLAVVGFEPNEYLGEGFAGGREYLGDAEIAASASLVCASESVAMLPPEVVIHELEISGNAEFYVQSETFSTGATRTAKFVAAFAGANATCVPHITLTLEAEAYANNAHRASARVEVGEFVVVARALPGVAVDECGLVGGGPDRRLRAGRDGPLATAVCYSADHVLEVEAEVSEPSDADPAVAVETLEATVAVAAGVVVAAGQALVVEDAIEVATYADFDLGDDDQQYETRLTLWVTATVTEDGGGDAIVGSPENATLRSFELRGHADDYTQNQDYEITGVDTASFLFLDLPPGSRAAGEGAGGPSSAKTRDPSRYDVALTYHARVEALADGPVVSALGTLSFGDHVVVVTALAPAAAGACDALALGCDAAKGKDTDLSL